MTAKNYFFLIFLLVNVASKSHNSYCFVTSLRFYLLFLLDYRRIRIRIRTSYCWIRIRIQEAQKQTDPADPDPQHWLLHFRYRWGSSPLFTKEPTPESSPVSEYPGRRRPEKLVVEFSSPNIAKPFHVGHFRFNLLIPSVNLTLDQILEIVPQNKGLSPLSMCYVRVPKMVQKHYGTHQYLPT